MPFYTLAAQVLPILFVASVFQGKYWAERQKASRFILVFDIAATATFVVGEAAAIAVVWRQKPFTGSAVLVAIALVFQGLGVVVPAIRERIAAFWEKTSSREAAGAAVAVAVAAAIALAIFVPLEINSPPKPVVVPALALVAPAPGAIVRASTPLLFQWAPVPIADYYNMQLFRNGRKVLSTWPGGNQVRIPAEWTFKGSHMTLEVGRYRWYVWPGLGPVKERTYGSLLGNSSFVVVG